MGTKAQSGTRQQIADERKDAKTGGLTSGMAYTKLPIGLNDPDESPGVDVAR